MPAPFPEAISRFCNTCSFSGGHFQGPLYFLDFRLPRPPKWGEPHKSTKIVDFAILLVNGGNPTKAPKLSILQYPLLFRRPFPRPLAFLGFPASVRGMRPKAEILSRRSHQQPRIRSGGPPKSSEFDNCHEDRWLWHANHLVIFVGFGNFKAFFAIFCPAEAIKSLESVREDPQNRGGRQKHGFRV